MPRDRVPAMGGVTVERDVTAVMRDGTVLRADVYRPPGDSPQPVLLTRTPYDKRAGAPTFGNAHPAWFAARGYVVVVQDTRGRFASEGEFSPFLHEMEDGYDTVEWAATLPGSDGRVAMMGFSYLGATQLLAAVMRPPALAAIAPAFTASRYHDGWTYDGGALALAFTAYWATLLAVDTARRHDDVPAMGALLAALGSAPDWFWTLPLAEYPPLRSGHAPYFFEWLTHPTYDEYWSRWSIDERYDRIDVPALHVGGWYDVFLSGTVRNFLGLRGRAGSADARRRQKLVVGPWAHMPWTPLGRLTAGGPSTNEIDDWHLRFFDEVLKGSERGVFDHAVTAYVLDGDTVHLDDWPPPEAVPEDWYAHSGGRANSKFGDGTLDRTPPGSEPPDIFVYDPGVPIISMGGHSCCFDAITPMGPADQHAAECSRMMLVYTSEPLTADVEILGDVSVTLYAASTATDTDFTARLCVVANTGVSVNLQEGILRTRYRSSATEPMPLPPGEVVELTIELGPVGARVPAGSRLRLDVSSSDFPQWDRNLNTGGPLFHEGPEVARPATQTVLHDASHPTRIRLPVIRR